MPDGVAVGTSDVVGRDMAAEFAAMLDTPEMRVARAERQRVRAARREQALAEHGSEEAVWAPCERERALEEACRPLILPKPILGGDLVTLEGWSGGSYDRMSPDVRTAVATAWPAPASPREAWAELSYWRSRCDERRAFFEDHEDVVWIQAREALLEHLLDTLPAGSLNDVRARLDWTRYLNDLEWPRGSERDGVLLDRLRADVERMGEMIRTGSGGRS